MTDGNLSFKNDLTNFDIEGYCCDHVFASKSLGTTKGRYSGGISVYYRLELKDYVSVAEKMNMVCFG